MMHRHTLLATMIATMIAGLAAAPVRAQYALGDGRALDANLRQGSGGLNEPGVDPRLQYGAYQDAIITGNVPGLARFRGDIDYRAAGEFTDRLSTDSTYAARLASLPTTPINDFQRRQLGQVQSPYASPFSQQSTVLRGGRGVTLGDVTAGAAAPGAIRDDVNTYTAIGPGRARTLDTTLLDAAPQTIGLTLDAETGALSNLQASPLIGLRVVPVNQGPKLDLPPRLRAADAPVADDPAALPARPTREPAPEPTDEEGDEPQQPPLTGQRIDSGAITAVPAQPIDDRVAAGRLTGDRPRSDLPAGVAGNWADVQPGQDVYVDLLRKLGRLPQGDEPVAVAPPPPNQNVPNAANPGQPGDEPGTTPPATAADDRPDPAEFDRRRREMVKRLAEQIALDAAPLTTFVGVGDSEFDRQMAIAERRMREGAYFKAEDAYVQALRQKPGHPMAMVGRMHAQIGSGLHLSAATNLRELLIAHPELIPTRYGEPLMPGADRLRQVSERLAAVAGASDRPEIPLLVAYLAFQQDNAPLLEQALDAADERSAGKDSLIALLREVWANAKPAPKPAEEVPGDASE